MSRPPKPINRSKPIDLQLRCELIDERAHDGRFQIVCNDKLFAIARWRDDAQPFGFVYPSGEPIEFTPTHYRPAAQMIEPEGAEGG